MRQFLFAAMVIVAAPAAAEEWRTLSGAEISDALSGKIVDYDTAWQEFRATGLTLYNAGADSWGTWDVRGELYCSQWPPNSNWTCYEVDLDAGGSAVWFRGAGDDVTIGRFRGTN